LGVSAKHEYFKLRDGYKAKGLEDREAVERACIELRIMERWEDWKERKYLGEALGKGVPLTPEETQAAVPSYEPPRVAKAEEIGDQDMALAEQVKWAQRVAARVQNGEDPPTKFPCDGALFWYQSAVSNRREFEKVLLRVEAPGGDPDNLYLQDSQYQYSEIEKNLRECLEEVGERWEEYYREFKEKYGQTAEARD
jgi:hypothetical protein